MSAKSRSSLFDTPGSKATPGTPRVAKLGKTPSKSNADSPSPLQNPRASAERSPRTISSKSGIARLSPRVATPPEKAQSRILKPSELQSQLIAAQDELKKAKEKLVLVEKEKAQALSELEEARKLQEPVVAQKEAEERSEEVGIEGVGKNEEEWKKELQEVRNQHAMDMASLLSTSEELERIKQELAMVTDTKNQALIHADEATKIAEIHAEKVEVLSAELARLNSLLDSTIKTEASGSAAMMELNLELDTLKQELEMAKGFEKNLTLKVESCVLLESELTSVKEELERAKSSEKIMAQKEEFTGQLELEFESMKQELEKAKGLEENLFQKEEALKQLKEELERAKSLEAKLSLREESYEQLKLESESLKHEVEKAKGFEENLVKKDDSLQQLKSELEYLKQELEKAKGFEEKLSQREESYEQLKSEAVFLKHELEKAKGFEENLVQKDESLQQLKLESEFLKQELQKAISFEESYEQLNVELEASRIAESYARNLLEEWKNKVEVLEGKVDLLHKAEFEINSLKEKVSLLEISLGRQKVDQEELDQNLEKTREEASAAAKEIVSLKSELEAVKEVKVQALEKEKLAACSVQELLEEKKKLVKEIEASREEEEKSKAAMESLASALHEVSAEAREAKEKLLSGQSERANLDNQIEDLKLTLKATIEKYESLLDDAKCEINRLTSNMDQSNLEFEHQIEDMRLVTKETNEKYETLLSDAKHEIDQLKDAKSEWEQKEVQLVNCLKTAEDEKLALSAENEDAKHAIDHLRKVVEESKMEYESSKSEWKEKELELVSSVRRFEEEKLAHKTTDVNYGAMLDDAKDEIKHLSNMMEKSKVQYGNSKHEWEKKELRFMNSVKRSEEEKSSMEKEIMRLASLLRKKEEEAHSEKEEGSELRNTLKEAISDAARLREALEEAKAEALTLKTDLQDRESQLQRLTRENSQPQSSADANIRKVEELSKLLEEATAGKQTMGNGELSDSEKDYDMLPRVVEFSEENGHVHRLENQPQQQLGHPEKEASASKTLKGEGKGKGEDSVADLEPKMWESCKIDEHDFSMEREGEQESIDDELDSKAESGEGFDQLNGVQSESNKTSPSKEQQQKKKKPLYRKFGNLIKKGIGNQK